MPDVDSSSKLGRSVGELGGGVELLGSGTFALSCSTSLALTFLYLPYEVAPARWLVMRRSLVRVSFHAFCPTVLFYRKRKRLEFFFPSFPLSYVTSPLPPYPPPPFPLSSVLLFSLCIHRYMCVVWSHCDVPRFPSACGHARVARALVEQCPTRVVGVVPRVLSSPPPRRACSDGFVFCASGSTVPALCCLLPVLVVWRTWDAG